MRGAPPQRIPDFPSKLASPFLKKSGESDDLRSRGRRNDPPLPSAAIASRIPLAYTVAACRHRSLGGENALDLFRDACQVRERGVVAGVIAHDLRVQGVARLMRYEVHV